MLSSEAQLSYNTENHVTKHKPCQRVEGHDSPIDVGLHGQVAQYGQERMSAGEHLPSMTTTLADFQERTVPVKLLIASPPAENWVGKVVG